MSTVREFEELQAKLDAVIKQRNTIYELLQRERQQNVELLDLLQRQSAFTSDLISNGKRFVSELREEINEVFGV